MFFAHVDEPWDPKQLFIRSKWTPDTDQIPRELQARVDQFLRDLKPKFRPRKVKPNLTHLQAKLLRYLKDSPDFIIFPTDKNLGPAILERSERINRALKDHVEDPLICKQLPEPEAIVAIAALGQTVESFIEDHHGSFTKLDQTHLCRSLEVDDPFPHFCITAKVHKTPWKTRPVVSTSGGILHGLGNKWVDRRLQLICRSPPTCLKSSCALKTQLSSLSFDAQRVSFFTADAVSMGTNIDTDHALSVVSEFLRTHPLCQNICNFNSINRGLEILMRNNLFKFGNTCWLQLEGTAMGAPPACMCATLHFAI